MAADGAPGPATYSEAAFDRFDPLDPAPSLTIQSGDVRVSDPIVMRAARIDGGVLVSASRSPNLPSTPDDRLPVVAVDHDGTIRWSRCLDGNRELQTVVAAPAHRPSLSISGDVLVSELTSDVVSGAVESIGTGAVVARWHDGTWSSETLEPPGWVLLDDRTGREVPGQRWDDPELFTLYPSREVSGFNRTARAGGLVIVVKGDQVEVWYPKGTGGDPRSVVLP